MYWAIIKRNIQTKQPEWKKYYTYEEAKEDWEAIREHPSIYYNKYYLCEIRDITKKKDNRIILDKFEIHIPCE